MTSITIRRLKKMALGWIEKAGNEGVAVERISRHISSSLSKEGLISRRGNVWVANKR